MKMLDEDPAGFIKERSTAVVMQMMARMQVDVTD